MCVVKGPLRARPKPSIPGDLYAPTFETGRLVFVIDGPVESDGYAWYLVHEAAGWVEFANGWLAAADHDETPWLAPASVICAPDPSLRVLRDMDPLHRLHCYHAREFTFTDSVVTGPMCRDGILIKSPAWMAGCTSTFWWGRDAGVMLAVPPDLADNLGSVDVDVPFEATITAHMDDAAAQTCLPDERYEDNRELLLQGTILACRGMFVATAFQRVSP